MRKYISDALWLAIVGVIIWAIFALSIWLWMTVIILLIAAVTMPTWWPRPTAVLKQMSSPQPEEDEEYEVEDHLSYTPRGSVFTPRNEVVYGVPRTRVQVVETVDTNMVLEEIAEDIISIPLQSDPYLPIEDSIIVQEDDDSSVYNPPQPDPEPYRAPEPVYAPEPAYTPEPSHQGGAGADFDGGAGADFGGGGGSDYGGGGGSDFGGGGSDSGGGGCDSGGGGSDF